MMTDYSLAFRGFATSNQPTVHRAGRASRRGFKSVQSRIAARFQKAGLYLRRYLGLYRLGKQMNCISEFQCKSLHSLNLQFRDIRYSPCASASLTLRVGKVSVFGVSHADAWSVVYARFSAQVPRPECIPRI